MTRLFLRALNTPALILLTLMAIAIQTSLFTFWPLRFLQPDIALILVIWCALRRSFTEGGIITLILGNIAEVHSSAPQGLFMISYMIVYLSLRASARVLVIPNLSFYVVVTAVASVFDRLINLGVMQLLGAGPMPLQNTLVMTASASVVNALLARWIFHWLDHFDWITFKNVRAEQVLDDEYQLDRPESLRARDI